MSDLKNKFFGCFFGAIVGDALGMPYEFKQPEDIDYKPEMLAGGPFHLPKGCWIDDLIDVEDLILKCEQLYQLRLKLNK